ncbi:hypothetical protein V498_01801 [Pseudogymnoascus sp. VKM F-4517 (FW-2822)]|nr:hypothetical protein V498_01801 [Pseudogymnoascus sp. VKM F-4517 (FW-2822)]
MSDLHIELTAPNGRKYIQPIGLFINNEWVKSSNGRKITSINPTDESEITSVYSAGAVDIDLAVVSARNAFNDPSWRDISPTDRGNMIIALSDLVAKHASTLATIETWDNGKPYNDALGDVAEVQGVFKYYGGYADKIHGQVIDTGANKLAYTVKEPVGVCGQIIPWNFPLAMASWKLGPALACGNTVVIKAAEQTPLSILYLAELVKEAGFPPGVVNIVNGYGREAGTAIVTHLETGGKSPLLVFEDADIEQAVKWAHIGIMSNQGQICTATSRILVQDSVYDSFITAFKKHVQKVSVVGDPFAETTFQGPQVTKSQYDSVLGYIQAGKDEGATLISGGEAFTKGPISGKGFFITPAIFTGVKTNMKIYREEVFGPFVVITTFSSEEDALKMANDTIYGLGSAVFTRDITRAHRVARRIEAGMVWINSSNDSDYRIPFGGVKQSGIGCELGEAGMAGYSQTKAVHVNIGLML